MLQQTLQHHRQAGLYRQRRLMTEAPGLLQFSSNDYLSLASDATIQQAFQSAFAKDPIGSGGSAMVCGYHPAHRALERAFAEALSVDDCLLFSSGYAANLSIATVLKNLHPMVFIDKSVHASVYDGLMLANVPFTRFLHNHLEDLSQKMTLQSVGYQKKSALDFFRSIIMTESVFSMSGQAAPLKALSQLAKTHSSTLLVDEAHAFGVFGREGLGSVIEAGLTQQEVPLRMIPFGKALGASGAIVAGQGVWIEALSQTRQAIYSTATSPAYARGMLTILEMIRFAEDRRKHLKQLINYFRSAIARSPLSWRDSSTPIQQLKFGCPHRATAVADALWQQGIVCMAMRQPTVTRDETGLRVILNYHHQPEQIDTFFQAVHQAVKADS